MNDEIDKQMPVPDAALMAGWDRAIDLAFPKANAAPDDRLKRLIRVMAASIRNMESLARKRMIEQPLFAPGIERRLKVMLEAWAALQTGGAGDAEIAVRAAVANLASMLIVKTETELRAPGLGKTKAARAVGVGAAARKREEIVACLADLTEEEREGPKVAEIVQGKLCRKLGVKLGARGYSIRTLQQDISCLTK